MSGEETPKKQGLSEPWKPGQSGNPNGRPKGSRNKLAELFWSDLYGAWQARGSEAIQRMIDEKPWDFVKAVGAQMPKELLVKGAGLEDVSDEELTDFIATLRHLANTGNPKKGRNGTSETAH